MVGSCSEYINKGQWFGALSWVDKHSGNKVPRENVVFLIELCRRYQKRTSPGSMGDMGMIQLTGGTEEVRAHLCGMNEIPLEARCCLPLKCVFLLKLSLNRSRRSKYWLQLSLAHLNQQKQLDFETFKLDLNTLCSLLPH